MKRLPIGLSDYKRIIEEDWYYIDKTLMIEELVNVGGIVTLLPRPRRFGKTLNMSMLKYFFEKTETSHRALFENKEIWSVPKARGMQGKFPVIFITFKDVKGTSWQETYNTFIYLIADEYRRHKYLLDGEVLDGDEKAFFQRVTSLVATKAEYYRSLLYLSQFLERFYKEKTVILIDEYDAPIHGGFVNGYYEEVIVFMQGFLGGGLKDNTNLQWGVVTGILRTAKEGIFSGINNFDVFTLLDNSFADKFGFTEPEIDQLLKYYELESIKIDFKSWYNGYHFGSTKIYNPWSALSCIKRGGELRSYWANTSDNALISKIVAASSPQIKNACAELIKGNVLPNIQMSDQVIFSTMENNSQTIWSLLLFSGYLTTASHAIHRGAYEVDLILPNQELVILFQDMVIQLFKQSLDDDEIILLKKALKTIDGQLFSTLLSKFIRQSMSWHDISEDEPEKSYHLFVLGLLVTLSKSYSVRSNRESGYGRYDILLVPRDLLQPGFIIEFKKKEPHETMEECARRALEQVVQKKYASELESIGIKTIALFGIAFHKKEVVLKQQFPA